MCEYYLFPKTYELCKLDPKHVIETGTRADWAPDAVDIEGRDSPDPCQEEKMSDWLCSYTRKIGQFGQS